MTTSISTKYSGPLWIEAEVNMRPIRKEGGAHMISPNGINLLNSVTKCHCLVSEQLKEIVWCAFAREETELLVNGHAPCYDDTGSNL